MFNHKGEIVRITLAQQYLGTQCYEVRFSDHLTISGDSKLTIPTENIKYRKRLDTYKGRFKFRRPLRKVTAEQLLTTPLVDRRNRKTLSVPTTNPLSLPHKDLPIPPFIFGFWFFARRSTGRLAPASGTSEYVLERFRDYGYKTRTRVLLSTGERDFDVYPTIQSQLIPNVPKIIPNNYLLASEEQRIDLLSGIICSKNRQYNEKSDTFRFCSKNYDTARRVQLLVESLGCKSSLIFDIRNKNYTVMFRCRIQIHPKQVSPPPKVHYGRRYVTEITPIQPQLCVHIETNGEDSTILAGEGFIPCL